MIALKISKNGRHLCTAGAEDLGILNTNVVASGLLGPKSKKAREDETVDFCLHIGGLTARHDAPDDHLRWNNERELELGDKIEIELVDTIATDAPHSTSPQDAKRSEENLKEKFDCAKAIYFQYKDQYENEDG